MNNDEAKFVLRAYRPSGRDSQDTAFAEALQQARQDPALATWFEREQNHDRLIAGKLREINPPADLREKILTGARMSRVRRPMRGRWTTLIGLAASIAVVVTLGDLWQGRRLAAAQQDLARFTVNDTAHGDHHADQGPRVRDMLALLASREVALPGSLDVDIGALKRDGCRTVMFNGREAIEVCFNRDGTWYHLYVMERGALPSRVLGRRPALLAENHAAVAVWSDDRYDYALVSPKGMAALERLAT